MSTRVTTLIALLSFLFLAGGMWTSESPAVTATPMGTLIDATRHVRDSTMLLPDVLFGVGIFLAVVVVVGHVLGMRQPNYRKFMQR